MDEELDKVVGRISDDEWDVYNLVAIPFVTLIMQGIRRAFITRSNAPSSVVTTETESALTLAFNVGSVECITFTFDRLLYEAPASISQSEKESRLQMLKAIPSALSDWVEACLFNIFVTQLENSLEDLHSVDIGYTDRCIVLTYHISVFDSGNDVPTTMRYVVRFRLSDADPHDVIQIGQSIHDRLSGFIQRDLNAAMRDSLAPILATHLSGVMQKMIGPDVNFSWEYGDYHHYVGEAPNADKGYKHHYVINRYRDLTYQCADVSYTITPVDIVEEGKNAPPPNGNKPYSPLHSLLEFELRRNYVSWWILDHSEQYVRYHIQDLRGAIEFVVRVGDADTFSCPEGMEEL